MNGSVSASLAEIWVYLAREPLAALTATLSVWLFSQWVCGLVGRHPLANPVLISILLLSGFLVVAGIDYRSYFQGAQFVHFLLGPATVALAIPLYRTWVMVRRSLVAVLTSVLVGGLVAAGTGVALAMAFGAERSVVASLVPRSVTTPVAMGISERIAGLPSLTAAVVVLTGICGAVIGTHVLNAVGVKDWRARGLAMGTAAHAIGTARALTVHSTAGAFSALAMGLNALIGSAILPLLWVLVPG
jgi:predicted murein hydrolase (TIGR00659 family)